MEKHEVLYNFLREYYHSEVQQQLTEDKPALSIDFSLLDIYDPVIADQLLEQPDAVLKEFKEAVKLFDSSMEKMNVRVRNLPEKRLIRLRNLRAEHIGKLISTDVIVKSATEIKPQVYEIIYSCPDCANKIAVPQDDSPFIQKPSVCICGFRGDFNQAERKLYDFRWLRGVEPFEITTGEQPSEIMLLVKEDLTTPKMQRKTDPGNRIRVVGILKEIPRRIKGKVTTILNTHIEVNYFESSKAELDELELTEDDVKKILDLSRDPGIYEKLRGSIAPGIYGFNEIKESIALQLFGGVPHVLPDGSRTRGNIHILLTGDPGVGKSVILKLVSTIVPRARYVSGSGVSGVGLCATYDTLITMRDGSITRIGELVEEKMKLQKKELEEGVFISDGDGSEIIAFDQENLKIKSKKITKYWKLKSPKKLIKIVSRTGKELKLTLENPVPVIKNGETVWKKACDVKKGEYIASPRIIYTDPQNNASVFNLLDKTVRLINTDSVMSPVIDKIKQAGTIREFSRENSIGENNLYHGWRGNKAPTIQTMMKLCEEVDTSYHQSLTGGWRVKDFGVVMQRETKFLLHSRTHVLLVPSIYRPMDIPKSFHINIEELLPDDLELTQYMGHKIKFPKHFTEDMLYFFGLIAGDGNIYRSKHGGLSLWFSSNDNELLNSFSYLSKSLFEIEPEYYKHPDRIPYLRIHSKIIGSVAEKFGIPSGKKSHKLRITRELSRLPNNLISAYIKGLFDTDGYVAIQQGKGSDSIGFNTASKEFAIGLQLLLLRFGIISKIRKREPTKSIIKGRYAISTDKYSLEIRGIETLRKFNETIGFGSSVKQKKLDCIIQRTLKKNTNIDIIPEISCLLKKARLSAGMTSKMLYGYKNYAYEKNRIMISRDRLSKIVEKMPETESGQIRRLKVFANSDIFWDEIIGIEIIDGEDYVYDVTVEDDHSFVANGLIMHNTASVRKDEVLGSWVLEAGALILCNKGLIAIDEFDKMSKDDQIAMHEATSIETVSIAKASIVATLPAQTAVLAGANPKYGRFEQYKGILEQVDIPDTLLSRFDLKFALKDIPDKLADERMADHIITSRILPETVVPEIELDLLRKYIAYARRIENVALTKEAADMLKNFYVEMRNAYPEGGVVSITLRQYEALLRLSEASAKIRLDTRITIDDAKRSINLMKFSLMQLGSDEETGRIDIDKLESGISSRQRSKIRIIQDIIAELQKEGGKEVAISDIEAQAGEQGVETEKAREIIHRLKDEGMLFEPKPGYVKRT
ncbi:MAG: hypothetical protein HZB65_01070 [Candidatus Aenigmarchaeota archaeon]|nr:hypothetical protein [Candidatus Aenigmarchaeota archaeon]